MISYITRVQDPREYTNALLDHSIRNALLDHSISFHLLIVLSYNNLIFFNSFSNYAAVVTTTLNSKIMLMKWNKVSKNIVFFSLNFRDITMIFNSEILYFSLLTSFFMEFASSFNGSPTSGFFGQNTDFSMIMDIYCNDYGYLNYFPSIHQNHRIQMQPHLWVKIIFIFYHLFFSITIVLKT